MYNLGVLTIRFCEKSQPDLTNQFVLNIIQSIFIILVQSNWTKPILIGLIWFGSIFSFLIKKNTAKTFMCINKFDLKIVLNKMTSPSFHHIKGQMQH